MAARRLVLAGSPRAAGTCAAVAERLATTLRGLCPDDDVELLGIAGRRIAGCDGCDECRGKDACRIHDDADDVLAAIDACDLLYVVAPVYFAGVPSQLKALLDRLQPHFWRGTRTRRAKRAAYLCAIGDGGDPWGCEPWKTTCASSLGCAGFRIDACCEHVGGDPDAARIAEAFAAACAAAAGEAGATGEAACR